MNLASDYKNVHFSPSVFFLYLNRLLIQIGIGIYGIFGVIFIFEQFNNSVVAVLSFYLVFYFATAIMNHVSAKLIGVFGMRNMMIISIAFLLASTLSLFFWEINPYFFLIMYFVTFVMYKMFYWVPFHIEFASFTDKKTRGKQMAVLGNISQVFVGALPVVGGFLIAYQGYQITFLLAGIIIALSIIPLFLLKETKETYTWKAFDLIRELFDKNNRNVVIANIGSGFHGAVGIVIWPIFIFIVLEGNYASVGAITSFTIIALIILRFFIGNLLDTIPKEKIIRISTIADITGWIAKTFIESATGIFLVHTYHQLGRSVQRLSFDTEIYEQAADNGHYVDEYTVLKETSLMTGRCIMFAAALVIVSITSIKMVFILAALASLLMTLISRKNTLSPK